MISSQDSVLGQLPQKPIRRRVFHLRAFTRFALLITVGLIQTGSLVGQSPQPFSPSRHGIETGYGRGRGVTFAKSLNGTSVLEAFFRRNGHQVDSARRLTPKLNDYETIFWFPNRMSPPGDEPVERLNQWLRDRPNRTLIYVGRDYDARLPYWSKLRSQLAGDQAEMAQRELAAAQADQDSLRREQLEPDSCEWFRTQLGDPQQVTAVSGPWKRQYRLDSLEVATGRVQLWPNPSRFPDQDAATLWLESEAGVPLIFCEKVSTSSGDSRVIVVTNGSLLLNLPLSVPDNRVIAQCLASEISGYGDILFLHSGPEEIEVSNSDVASDVQWAWISEPPLRFIIPQFLILGVLLCFVYYPILGRPRRETSETPIRFGLHVDAVARSLSKSEDLKTAERALERFRESERTGWGQPRSNRV